MPIPSSPRPRALLSSRCFVGFCWSLLVLAVPGMPKVLRAETTAYSGATQITALPVTISTPGTYFLAQDFSVNMANGYAITIGTAGVTIDLNGHTITNTAGGATGAIGIFANTKDNLAVSNGSLNGFAYGVAVWGSAAKFENLTFVQSVTSAIYLYGSNGRIHRCRAILTGGSSSSYSFWVPVGSGDTVEDCDVCGKGGTSMTAGICFEGSNHFALNNRISGVDVGIVTNNGATFKFRDNLTSGVTTPYTGGTDAGNNN